MGSHSTPFRSTIHHLNLLAVMTYTTAPSSLRAGDSMSWQTSLPHHTSASGWSLHHRIVWRYTGIDPVNFTGTDTGAGQYTTTLNSADTASYTAGPATLITWVQNDTQRQTIGQQALDILPDLTTATSNDTRSLNRKALDDARAALAAYSASSQAKTESYTINDRSMKFRAVTEIIDLINYYERQVAAETALQAAINGVASGRVVTRM